MAVGKGRGGPTPLQSRNRWPLVSQMHLAIQPIALRARSWEGPMRKVWDMEEKAEKWGVLGAPLSVRLCRHRVTSVSAPLGQFSTSRSSSGEFMPIPRI